MNLSGGQEKHSKMSYFAADIGKNYNWYTNIVKLSNTQLGDVEGLNMVCNCPLYPHFHSESRLSCHISHMIKMCESCISQGTWYSCGGTWILSILLLYNPIRYFITWQGWYISWYINYNSCCSCSKIAPLTVLLLPSWQVHSQLMVYKAVPRSLDTLFTCLTTHPQSPICSRAMQSMI